MYLPLLVDEGLEIASGEIQESAYYIAIFTMPNNIISDTHMVISLKSDSGLEPPEFKLEIGIKPFEDGDPVGGLVSKELGCSLGTKLGS